MDMLDQDLDGRVTMDGNSEESTSTAHWEVVEVVEDFSSNRGLHADVVCTDGVNSQEVKVNVDEPPQITDGTVTYRVVQLTPDLPQDDVPTAQIVTTSAALVSGQQVAQAIIANPFSATNGGASPGAEGPFYVMMSPQDVLQTGQRALAPRTHQFSPKMEGARTARDERRRATHNEVERRRRDKINNWIVKLSKIVPDCTSDHSKQGQFYTQSKGGILAKACDYIQELRTASNRVPEILKENERLNIDLDLLRQQCEELKNENQVLRAHLQQHGIVVGNINNSS